MFGELRYLVNLIAGLEQGDGRFMLQIVEVRIRYALLQHTDPTNENRRDISGLSLAIMGVGLL